KAIEIRQSLEPELQVAEADQGQLEQVLLNILINADQAMPENGSILIETRNIEPDADQCMRLGLKRGRYVRIKIEDTGVGMEEDIVSRIFEPFFTTKELGRGTGLGLASAYGIIKNHGGGIDVESTPGQGSRFFVYLPASEGSLAPEYQPLQGMVTGKGTILLVDDEKIIRKVNSSMHRSRRAGHGHADDERF
ncbi:MAG: ATP-binding protein, partial [Desulfosarcinaceae bacterium]